MTHRRLEETDASRRVDVAQDIERWVREAVSEPGSGPVLGRVAWNALSHIRGAGNVRSSRSSSAIASLAMGALLYSIDA